jgi:hypothetical protein
LFLMKSVESFAGGAAGGGDSEEPLP